MDYKFEDSSILSTMDQMKKELDSSDNVPNITYVEGNYEVKDIIQGYMFTRNMRQSVFRSLNIKKWQIITAERYERYYKEITDNCDGKITNIIENIRIIHKSFRSKHYNMAKLIKHVIKTDKEMLEYIKEIGLVKY